MGSMSRERSKQGWLARLGEAATCFALTGTVAKLPTSARRASVTVAPARSAQGSAGRVPPTNAASARAKAACAYRIRSVSNSSFRWTALVLPGCVPTSAEGVGRMKNRDSRRVRGLPGAGCARSRRVCAGATATRASYDKPIALSTPGASRVSASSASPSEELAKQPPNARPASAMAGRARSTRAKVARVSRAPAASASAATVCVDPTLAACDYAPTGSASPDGSRVIVSTR